MEHSEKDVQLSIKVRKASEFARQKNFDDAINILDELIDHLLEYDLDHSAVCVKVIPYFQKAGRFSELEEYVSNKIIPVGMDVRKKSFSHQNALIQEAYCHLLLSQISDKLRLCAKREKAADLESYYAKRSSRQYEDYLSALERGEAEKAKETEEKFKQIFGPDKSTWPDPFNSYN